MVTPLSVHPPSPSQRTASSLSSTHHSASLDERQSPLVRQQESPGAGSQPKRRITMSALLFTEDAPRRRRSRSTRGSALRRSRPSEKETSDRRTRRPRP